MLSALSSYSQGNESNQILYLKINLWSLESNTLMFRRKNNLQVNNII